MSDLVKQQDYDYVHRRFANAFFLTPENTPGIFKRCRPNEFNYLSVTGEYDNAQLADRTAGVEFLDSLSRFSLPTLGWRSALGGKMLVYLQRNNSGYGRGTGGQNLTTLFSPLTEAFYSQGMVDQPTEAQKCLLAFNQDFMSLRDGVRGVREGSLLGFAISPTIAVYADSEDTMKIMFRNSSVGKIDANNKIKVNATVIRQQLGEL